LSSNMVNAIFCSFLHFLSSLSVMEKVAVVH
jgi:hypothetical protein